MPAYCLAAQFVDWIGHRLLQLIGFFVMGLAFLLIGVIPHVTTTVTPFLILFGLTYFFAELGPNTTTFILPAEIYPTSARATGHGISAGIAKVGAFLGVFLLRMLGTTGETPSNSSISAVATPDAAIRARKRTRYVVAS